MMASNELTIFVSYSQLAVFDRSLERPFNVWTNEHVAQGFSWRPGSVAFRTIEEDGPHLVAINPAGREGDLEPAAVRVIDVPFEVPPGGLIEVGSISDSAVIELPAGMYQLRFEGFAREDHSNARVCLRFSRSDNPHFEIIRADSGLNPDTELLLTAAPA